MFAGLVAILTFIIQPPLIRGLVNITVSRGFLQNRVHVGMFDSITATADKMAIHTTGGPAGSAHILSDFDQIHVLLGKAGPRWRFFVGFCSVMADKAVDLGHIGEIKGPILPAVANVATGAARPISIYIDAKIVYRVVSLAQVGAFFMSYRVR